MPCWYCGVRFKGVGRNKKTKDHVVPRSKGGMYTVMACLGCNQAKADMSVEEFREKRGGIEFYAERIARLSLEETACIAPAPAKKKEPPVVVTPPPKKIVPDLSQRKTYVPREAIVIKLSAFEKSLVNRTIAKSAPHELDAELIGYRFGILTVVRYFGKRNKTKSSAPLWECCCACGNLVHRTIKAVRNPANNVDACIACRKVVGDWRHDFYASSGIRVDQEFLFTRLYGHLLP